jgi:hypothetical protein
VVRQSSVGDLAALPRREKSGIRAAGADLEVHSFGTAWTMSHVGRAVAIGVDAGIHVATREVNTQERTGLLGLAVGRGRSVGTEIELRAFVVHSVNFVVRIPPAEAGSPGPEF